MTCQAFDQKLLVANDSKKKPMSEKRKKDLFKQLIQDAIGVGLSSIVKLN